jgi:membrane-bound metal-dependent hydrolase YbcI (DUF457 family)
VLLVVVHSQVLLLVLLQALPSVLALALLVVLPVLLLMLLVLLAGHLNPATAAAADSQLLKLLVQHRPW